MRMRVKVPKDKIRTESPIACIRVYLNIVVFLMFDSNVNIILSPARFRQQHLTCASASVSNSLTLN